MIKLKKVGLFICALLLTTSIVGCNKKSGSGQGGLAETDGGAYNEINDEDVESISVFKNDWADFNNARKAETPIYKKIKEKIGCDITAINSSSNWETQISFLQNDGDLPDIFLTNGPDNSYFFKNLIDNEDILPITDWVSEEHYPNIYSYLQQFNFLRKNVSYSKDKIWFIPSSWHLEKSLYIRTDWIENLNNKLDEILVKEGIVANSSELTDELRTKWKFTEPKDLLQFYRLARAFTLYDPDNNGKDDTYGYMSESNKDMDAWIYIAFDAGWDQFIKQGDQYIFSDVAEGSMYATSFITRMITEGYMSIDSLTGDIETKQSRFMNGKAGMMYAHNWYNVIASGFMAANKCSMEEVRNSIAIIEPPCGKNGTHGGDGEKGFWQGFCINRNMSNSRIRKCLEFYDFLLSEEGYDLLQYGIEGDTYEVLEDGTRKSLIPVSEDGFTPFLTSYDPATLLYALVEWTMNYKSTLQTNSDIIIPRQKEAEKNSNFSDYPCVTTDAYDDYYESSHQLFAETVLLLEKNEKSLFYEKSDDSSYNPKTFNWDSLYTVSRTFKNKWDSYVKKYLSSSYGGQQIIDEYNEVINSGKVQKVSKDDYRYN